MDYLSVCAIVKDETPYLAEWVEYHKLVGVERFYLYDNDSRIPVAETLASDISQETVIVTAFPGSRRQHDAYKDCMTNRKKDTFWLAFIDADEFICPKALDDIREILWAYERFAGVGVNWKVFGTSRYECRPDGLQIEKFLLRGADSFSWNNHIKTIAQPSFLVGMENAHFPYYTPKRFCVNTDGHRIYGPFNNSRNFDKIQINHYWCRSRAEFQEKIIRGAADGNPRNIQELFDVLEPQCNEVRDEIMLRFVPAVKRALSYRPSMIPFQEISAKP